MGRPSHKKALAVWMNGVRVGIWTQGGAHEPQFEYDADWFQHASFRAISLSIPADKNQPIVKGKQVAFYFDNLLPDSDHIRERLQSKFHTENSSAQALLEAIGRDCVGAIQLLPLNETPKDLDTISALPLSELEVEAQIQQAVTSNSIQLMEEDADDLRISIAGAQEKTALLYHKGQWCKPLGTTPTTHIFKLPLGLVGNRKADMSTSVENEWLCARILAEFKVPVAETEIGIFGETKVLIVKRFDRKLAEAGTHYLRLPQEDFCQAKGLSSSQKYEKEGGPGMAEIADMLKLSVESTEDIANFFRAQLIFWMLRATDGHAKNFSIYLLPNNRYRMTPLYDVLSMYPIMGKGGSMVSPNRIKMAMAWRGKNKHYLADTVTYQHFCSTMKKGGLAIPPDNLIEEIVSSTPGVIQKIRETLPPHFPSKVSESILNGLENAAAKLQSMRAAVIRAELD